MKNDFATKNTRRHKNVPAIIFCDFSRFLWLINRSTDSQSEFIQSITFVRREEFQIKKPRISPMDTDKTNKITSPIADNRGIDLVI